MWWDIIKSTRREAYSAFLEEFGPEVDLRFLAVENFLDDPDMQDVEYYLSLSNVSDEIMGYWVVQSNGFNIRFVSDRYPQHGIFVQGMFEQEYPERYKEIVNMINENIDDERLERNDVSQLISKYLEVSEIIMKLLRETIITRFVDNANDNALTVLIPITNPGYVRMLPRSVATKISADSLTKHSIIFAITEVMVDRMMREIHVFRNQEVERRVTARLQYQSGFRDILIASYYELFTTANSGGREPSIVSNQAVDNAKNELINYLKEIADEYLEVA